MASDCEDEEITSPLEKDIFELQKLKDLFGNWTLNRVKIINLNFLERARTLYILFFNVYSQAIVKKKNR